METTTAATNATALPYGDKKLRMAAATAIQPSLHEQQHAVNNKENTSTNTAGCQRNLNTPLEAILGGKIVKVTVNEDVGSIENVDTSTSNAISKEYRIAHETFMELAEQCIKEDPTLTIAPELLHPQIGTDATRYFRKGKNGLPQWCLIKGSTFAFVINGVGDETRSKRIQLTVGAPSMQSDAADKLRLISMYYIMFTKLTKANLKEWDKEQFTSFFNEFDNASFHIMTLSQKEKMSWRAERDIHRQVQLPKLVKRSKEVMEIHSQQVCDKQKFLVQLLGNGEEHLVQQYDKIAKKRIAAMTAYFLTGDKSLEDDLVNHNLRYQIQIGIGGPVDLHRDFPPGLGQLLLKFDMNMDIICFCDGRVSPDLHRQVPGWRKVSYTKKRFPFINEKSLTLHLLIQRMVDLKDHCTWSGAAHGKLIASLLGDGTLYRIGYGPNSTLRLVETCTQDKIRAACDVVPQGFLYRMFANAKRE